MTQSRPRVIWRFVDGVHGHDNQSAGLVAALRERADFEVFEPARAARLPALLYWAAGRYPPGAVLPAPDLLIGAGHSTHLSLLAARRARGGRIVMLMKPSLPCRWFDLNLIPEHDAVRDCGNVITTRGVINRIRPAPVKDRALGLFLIGGPSRHHDWQNEHMMDQVRSVVSHFPNHHWELTTSRRTPSGWLDYLRQHLEPGLLRRLTLHDWRELEPDWLVRRLPLADTAWVSEDSVSMVYEALTAGAAVGLLDVPAKGRNRVSRGAQSLLQNEQVVRYADWLTGKKLIPMREPLDEAGRCAEAILARWPVGG